MGQPLNGSIVEMDSARQQELTEKIVLDSVKELYSTPVNRVMRPQPLVERMIKYSLIMQTNSHGYLRACNAHGMTGPDAGLPMNANQPDSVMTGNSSHGIGPMMVERAMMESV